MAATPEVLRTPADRFDATAARYPWPPEYVELADGLRMAYVDAGDRDAQETMLLLHGEPMWGYLYRTMIPTLEDAGYRVVVPDLIGFGRSDKPTDPERYTYSQHVAWVSEFIERLDLSGMTIFGQDWGGLIGSRVLADLLPRFRRAVFSNTNLPGSGPAFPGIRAQERLDPALLEALTGTGWRAAVRDDDTIDADLVHASLQDETLPYFLSWRVYSQEVDELWPSKIVGGWCLTEPDDVDLAAYDAPFPSQEYVVGARRFPLLVPITEDDPERLACDAAWAVLERWSGPVLTVWGDRCPHTHRNLGADYRRRIPGAQLPTIDHAVLEASHFIQEDRGPELAERIVAFVTAHPG
jgi:haloalkane dehalogenase